MARLPNFLVIIRSEKLSGKGQGRGCLGVRKKERFVLGKRTFRSQKSKHFVLRIINKTFVVISGNVLSLAFLLFPFSISYIDMTAESMKLSSLNTERNRIDSMVRYYENLKSLDSSFSENLDSLILEEKKTLIRVIKEIDLKQFKIEEKQKRYEKPLVSILFLLQIFGFYILILYSSYFDRTNKVNRVIAVENIPYRKKVRSYFCDKVLKPLVLLLSVFLWGFLFFLWLR